MALLIKAMLFYLLNFSKFRSYHSLRSLEVIEVKMGTKKVYVMKT